MWSQTLLKDLLFTRVLNEVAAGTGTNTCTTVDMQDFDGILFLAGLGTPTTTGAVVTAQIQEGAASDGSDAALPTGGVNFAKTTPTSRGTILAEVYRPKSRYVTFVLNIATQNAVINGVSGDPVPRPRQPGDPAGQRRGLGLRGRRVSVSCFVFCKNTKHQTPNTR